MLREMLLREMSWISRTVFVMIDDEKKLVEVRIAGAIVSFEGESVRVCSCMCYVFFVIIHCLFMFLFICCVRVLKLGWLQLWCVLVWLYAHIVSMSYMAWYWWSGSPEASSGRNGAPRRVGRSVDICLVGFWLVYPLLASQLPDPALSRTKYWLVWFHPGRDTSVGKLVGSSWCTCVK